MGLFALAPLLSTGLEILNRVIPDPDLREKLSNELKSSVEAGRLQEAIENLKLLGKQLEVNAAEAKSQFLFVAGWRPAIGWTCGIALFYNLIIILTLQIVAWFSGMDITGFPQADNDTLMQIVLGMLGIAVTRTYEKYKGVNGDHTGKDHEVDELKWYKAKIKRLERLVKEHEDEQKK
jgi:hypothetical protein